jgi:hypothetical protein
MEWQPIETAPKDGTTIDLWVSAADCAFRAVDFKWEVTETQKQGQWVRAEKPLDWHYGNVGMLATHWMPRPAPPPRS